MKPVTAQYHTENELFEIPHNGDSIIYAPQKGGLLIANKNLVNLLCDIQAGVPVDVPTNKDTINRLKKLGIIYENPDLTGNSVRSKTDKDYDQPFLPNNLTLFLTSDCNLACRYCYGDGGDKRVNMPLEMAMDAVDFLFLNGAKSGARQVHLGFHGGGEPVLRLRAMKRLVEHARKLSENRGINLTLGLTTNGVMTRDAARWVAENIDQLNVSFDGPEDIQNYQRPMKNGGDSFKKIVQTLRLWDAGEKRYHFRGTITQFSQDRIPEIVCYYVENFRPAGIHLEPMFFSSRAEKARINGPDHDSFVKGFVRAARLVEKKGIDLHFSGHRFPKICNTFCGIGWKNFAVTPEGNVTSCFEVLAEEDSRSEIFFYGKYVRNKGFHFDQGKIAALRSLSETKLPFCDHCFAKFHCAGDCRAKGLYLNEISDFQGGGRCDIIRALTKFGLIEQLNLDEGE